MDDRDFLNNDVSVRVSVDLLEASNNAKNQLENFRASYTLMLNTYNELKGIEDFSGKAAQGFLELFDIILQFHKDLLERSPELYTSIEHGFERFEDFTNDIKYQAL